LLRAFEFAHSYWIFAWNDRFKGFQQIGICLLCALWRWKWGDVENRLAGLHHAVIRVRTQ
jgi:hypothetical protein